MYANMPEEVPPSLPSVPLCVTRQAPGRPDQPPTPSQDQPPEQRLSPDPFDTSQVRTKCKTRGYHYLGVNLVK